MTWIKKRWKQGCEHLLSSIDITDSLCTFGTSLPLKEAKIAWGDLAMVCSWFAMSLMIIRCFQGSGRHRSAVLTSKVKLCETDVTELTHDYVFTLSSFTCWTNAKANSGLYLATSRLFNTLSESKYDQWAVTKIDWLLLLLALYVLCLSFTDTKSHKDTVHKSAFRNLSKPTRWLRPQRWEV